MKGIFKHENGKHIAVSSCELEFKHTNGSKWTWQGVKIQEGGKIDETPRATKIVEKTNPDRIIAKVTWQGVKIQEGGEQNDRKRRRC